MEPIRGITACCGIGEPIEKLEAHIDLAGKAGINALFTSLQLPGPEVDKDTMFRDFPRMTAAAHRNGMKVCADYGTGSSNLGFSLDDLTPIRKLGIDILRLDGSYTNEQAAEMTFNIDGLGIQLQAADPFLLADLGSLKINPGNTYFCHNYYPMRYTGLRWDDVKKTNDIIRSYGFRVAGFIASRHHRRAPLAIGLPTLERHRDMAPSTAAQELMILGCEDIFFGDDLPSFEEMTSITALDGETVDLRFTDCISPELGSWLNGRTFRQRMVDIDAFVRGANAPDELYTGDLTAVPPAERKRGDVFIARSSMPRYGGEVQIARMDLPADEHFATVARVTGDDLPLLETYRDRRKFRLFKE